MSVMSTEVLKALSISKGNRIVDATFGGGGHAREIVHQGATVLGLDRDWDAIEYAKSHPVHNITVVHGNFADLADVVRLHGWEDVDGILFDLGVSSHQFDEPARGFSYRFTESDLDMRMDQHEERTALTIINNELENQLYEIFAHYGEEERARSIAHDIVIARRIKPFKTVDDLLQVISKGSGKNTFDTAGRIFQALRISVNKELDSLMQGLEHAEKIIKPGGKIVILTYHSLEDRIVKRMLQKNVWQVDSKHPLRPTEQEVERNSRSRSAKLRSAKRYG